MPGAISIIIGAISACVSPLCINGKIAQSGMVGVRLDISRNYRLYIQEKYWYDANRCGGKQTLPVLIAWVSPSRGVLILPQGHETRLGPSKPF